MQQLENGYLRKRSHEDGLIYFGIRSGGTGSNKDAIQWFPVDVEQSVERKYPRQSSEFKRNKIARLNTECTEARALMVKREAGRNHFNNCAADLDGYHFSDPINADVQKDTDCYALRLDIWEEFLDSMLLKRCKVKKGNSTCRKIVTGQFYTRHVRGSKELVLRVGCAMHQTIFPATPIHDY